MEQGRSHISWEPLFKYPCHLWVLVVRKVVLKWCVGLGVGLLFVSTIGGYIYVCRRSLLEFQRGVNNAIEVFNGGSNYLASADWNRGIIASSFRIFESSQRESMPVLNVQVDHSPKIRGLKISLLRFHGQFTLPEKLRKEMRQHLLKPLQLIVAGEFFMDREGVIELRLGPLTSKKSRSPHVRMQSGMRLRARFNNGSKISSFRAILPRFSVEEIDKNSLLGIKDVRVQDTTLYGNVIRRGDVVQMLLGMKFVNMQIKQHGTGPKIWASIKRGSLKYSSGNIPVRAILPKGNHISLESLTLKMSERLSQLDRFESKFGLNLDFLRGKVKGRAVVDIRNPSDLLKLRTLPYKMLGEMSFSVPKKVLDHHADFFIPYLDRMVQSKYMVYASGRYRFRCRLRSGFLHFESSSDLKSRPDPIPLSRLIGPG